MHDDRTDRYLVLGAGSSGLAVLKHLVARGVPCDCVERLDDVGGNWYYGQPGSSVYRSTHLISSKPLTEYADFPMPDHYPDYPSHAQAWEYLKAYARGFDLYPRIEFGVSVERLEPAGAAWDVRLSTGAVRRYRGVIIANGHNWDPRWPEFLGTFAGTMLHSCQYKTPEVLIGKRVLVVGAGNSGCDLAVESSQHAAKTWHSIRRGYHYLPKYVAGLPADQQGEWMLRWRFPLWLRRIIAGRYARLVLGQPERFGLPRPDHKLFETHPIINSQLLYAIAHGDVAVKPDVRELRGDRVVFADGTVETIDVILCATGFRLSFPFLDREHLNWRDERPEFFLHVFHPRHDTLFVAGMIQPDSGQWGLVEDQSRLIAWYLWAIAHAPAAAERFRRVKSDPAGYRGRIRYLATPRHALEVEHYSYRRALRRLLKRHAGADAAPPVPTT